jgi:ABC-2 type transport system ATP-binding protein
MTMALSTHNLTVRYGARTIVSDVSLEVPVGSVYALLGRNGSGKTSLIRCLLGQQKPEAGSAALFGRDAWRHRAALMARVGVVPETPDAPPDTTAAALVDFCAALQPVFDRTSVAERLRRFEIPPATRFGALSRGQRGAVMLALALAGNPELLVLDDPTLGLDAVARAWFFDELIGELADRGTTVFITTHDLSGIEGLATHVGFLVGGRLSLQDELEALKGRTPGTLEEIFTSVTASAGGAR